MEGTPRDSTHTLVSSETLKIAIQAREIEITPV
jgi:hypothetical protein